MKDIKFADSTLSDVYLDVLSFEIDTSQITGNTVAYFTTKLTADNYISIRDNFYNEGYSRGNTVGYNKGVEDAHTYTFLNLATAVIDAPVKTMLGLLDFEILGMDMQRFFLSILTAALIIAAYRLFSGGAA